ncbi:GNAT family N-acetyltransferase [Planococcus sp. CAU13]|uniref:GNAT family N-acetyltransferase n=1 Tax=Planococcus sp. CAU13 TaxID=1541197 RepID=UPI00052FF842|nr:GNAT family N-acetyltransferase [Planococcus sp. CAU13]
MKITLQPAQMTDAAEIHGLQIAAFTPLLEKYRDYEKSPANEPLEKTISRLRNPDSHYFRIFANDRLAGAIHIVRKEKNGSLWISPIFITPPYQGKGIAQQAMKMAEQKFPEDRVWELSTLAEETGNCYLYEKLGYERTPRFEQINERTTLVYYKKEMKQ